MSYTFVPPTTYNEPSYEYAKGSPERPLVEQALKEMKAQMPIEIPCVIGGKEIKTGNLMDQIRPDDVKGTPLARFHAATPEIVADAITRSVKAQRKWAATPWYQRATTFLRAAQLVTGKYRWQLMAATMLGQGKNVWQAEVDCIAELADFFRFSVKIVDDGYKQQPMTVVPDAINRIEYRPIEGFVLAVSPFNFTAIGGNLVTVPSILGGVAIWKPSPMSMYSNYLTHKILLEAGVPGDVIQFVPGDAEAIVNQCIEHRDFAALHFTGSTHVLRNLWARVGANVHKYRSLPRIIGETGGKNAHLLHSSADFESTIIQSIRAAFEYQGQKCSALGRLYLPRSLYKAGWLDRFVEETKKIQQGAVEEYTSFMGPVINERSFDNIMGLIGQAQAEGGKILTGGTGDKSKGYFVEPTIILTEDPKSVTMVKEIFGPVVTAYVYEDDDFLKVCDLLDDTSEYALTCALFAQDPNALLQGAEALKWCAGNLYLNERTPGAVVGQHPFGGSRSSGTNDKSGTWAHFSRFISAQVVKDNLASPPKEFTYPSNVA
ncbi:delta-1-pyrroline-5-carboxylate dehydrogenase 1 [Cutaneotrichosporon oleaginosum]|uniref:Multifunctional fusion protein n=1 Tax=Cutaneotrichosporon oleaginosum TaxID=879819 RepID=A0A0J0XRG7_9TREE|nr:delta-1-pyrroline-5-carboxylate dehydrogenase 1 [Cutaneotrichosporon oleaginosum]KLT43683.1 delta-1-pyrroline-5-carboxylate dehydrogenase 1 [Cutaneotrichosporon oleaginosum]TXT05102.1 hypothetical protein COLE_06422 [Cutaneotrichosporon oleaginosum]